MFVKKGHFYSSYVACFFYLMFVYSLAATEPVFFNGTNHWYEVINKPTNMTWHQCYDSAISKGGYLATIGSEEENNFILSLPIPPINAFLGASDELSEGVWVWVTGDTFWINGISTEFSNWDDGEPNNSNEMEHYLVVIAIGSNFGKWNDGYPNAENMSSFIVEYDTDPCCVGIRGNVNNNGGVTITDLTYLVNFLFNGGSAPACADEANVNGLSGITISDLTALVNFLFNGGPSPAACP